MNYEVLAVEYTAYNFNGQIKAKSRKRDGESERDRKIKQIKTKPLPYEWHE